MRSRSISPVAILILVTACARPGPTATPVTTPHEPSLTPAPTRWIAPTPTAPPPLPTPPPEFDPSDVIWVGNVFEGDSSSSPGVWVGTVDGIGRIVSSAADASGFRVIGGQAYWLPPEGTERAGTWTAGLEGEPRRVGPEGRFDVAVEAGTIVVMRTDAERRGEIWLYSLEGGAGRRVFPASDVEAQHTVISNDGRRIASARCGFQGENATTMLLAVDGVPQTTDLVVSPIGFDLRRRLIYEGCFHGSIKRIDEAGASYTLVDEELTESRVTRDGRFLIVLIRSAQTEADPLPKAIQLRIIRLDNGITWQTTIEGDWSLTDLGEDAFAILQGTVSFEPQKLRPLIVSLEGHWYGVLEHIPASWRN